MVQSEAGCLLAGASDAAEALHSEPQEDSGFIGPIPPAVQASDDDTGQCSDSSDSDEESSHVHATGMLEEG